jgi:hypothetical protein
MTSQLSTVLPRRLRQMSLTTVDLSGTSLTTFSSKEFSSFGALRKMNLSSAGVEKIGEEGFRHLPTVLQIDLRGNPVSSFHTDVYRGAYKLQSVLSPTYKLCCAQILPTYFQQHMCVAPTDEISSCDDLLRSETCRAFLWLISVLSLTGNAFCIIFRSLLHRASSRNAFNAFVTSLCLADLLMSPVSARRTRRSAGRICCGMCGGCPARRAVLQGFCPCCPARCLR